jgi:transposase
MGKTNRNQPKRAASSESRFTAFELAQEFPDDAACMDYLVTKLYPNGIFCPKCNKVTKHHRITKRPAYACQFCGHQEHPMKGTIFEGSSTSLKLWFEAIYLMASTRCGISAKQLEREIGVTYPTAWRMFNKIRSLLPQGDDFFSGTVEADEAYFGGRGEWMHKSDPRKGAKGRGTHKTPVFGMAQRGSDGKPGKVAVSIVPNVFEVSLMNKVQTKVLPASSVYTDDWLAYRSTDQYGYEHSRVNHSQKVYVSGDVHTQTIEGFWSLVKRGISGVYHGVSTKHLQSYLDEYVFRYNNRDATGRGMFDAFLSRIEKASPA